MSNDNLNPMTEDDIANYLVNTPDFFDRHAELLAVVQLVSPHSRRAVSLQERQAEMLREKVRMLELRIMEMIRHGNENMVLSDKLLRWAAELFQAQEAAELPALIASSIQNQFLVPQVAIRLWGLAPAHAGADFAQDVSDDAKRLARSLHEPFCGVNSGLDVVRWLAQPEQASSLALLPLRCVDAQGQPDVFGMLVLASPDSQRFTSTMGTDFLAHIADLASAALSPLR
jgi:uncharacterized protein YigA (DUF484 family)